MVYPSYPTDKGSIASGKGGWNISRSSRKTIVILIFQPGYSSNFEPRCLKLSIQNVWKTGALPKNHIWATPNRRWFFQQFPTNPLGLFVRCWAEMQVGARLTMEGWKGSESKTTFFFFFFEGLGVEVDGCDLGVWRSLGISGEFLFQSEFLSAEKPTFPQQLVNQLVTGSRFFLVPLSFRVVHIFWDVMLFFPFLVELKYTHLRWCLRALRCFFPRFFFHSQDDGLPGKPPAPWRGTRH